MRLRNIAGEKFGMLTAIERVATASSSTVWRFRCDCGEACEKFLTNIVRGLGCDCGCQRRLAGRLKKQFRSEYISWRAMRNRCLNPESDNFYRYGARGIGICERWSSFAKFLQDMGAKPFPEATIDRMNNREGYSPDNCKWASKPEQSNNRDDNIRITINGETLTAAQWADRYQLKRYKLYSRLKRGWPVERAVTTP